jgi:hypothetical protein
MRYRLRTLLVALTLAAVLAAIAAWDLTVFPPAAFAAAIIWIGVVRMRAALTRVSEGQSRGPAVGISLAVFSAAVAGCMATAIVVEMYLVFGFGRMFVTPTRADMVRDSSISFIAGAVPAALIYWLTWPRPRRSARTN